MIVCRELGLNFAKANITGDKYGVGAKMVMSKPICIGDELSLTQCLRDDQVTCSSNDSFAAVQCTDGKIQFYPFSDRQFHEPDSCCKYIFAIL